MDLMTKGYKQFGEVFTVPVAHRRITFLIGPSVSHHFFKASDDEMSQTEVGFSVTLMIHPALSDVLGNFLGLQVQCTNFWEGSRL